ncbi:hypothetical protein BH10CHL1_BH10CHL1_50120 [soil metagenome]
MSRKQRGVYLLHFSPRYKHAGHYIGFADHLPARIAEQFAGKGANLVQVALRNGCILTLACTWANKDRKFERSLKNRGGAARICPICRCELPSELIFTLDDVEAMEF